MIFALVALFGAALVSRSRRVRPSPSGQKKREHKPVFRPIPPLEPGESYDTSVKLASVPNQPLAHLWCQRLREEGIEAFYKPGPYLTGFYGAASVNAGFPVEVWVGQHDVERARQLFPELS
jgi:Putative prokaryotic signal transducing protein